MTGHRACGELTGAVANLPDMIETVELTVADGRLRADVAGPAAGEPVLLLHGFPQTRHTWRHQLPALAAAGFRAVAPDQRGYSPGLRPERSTGTTSTGWWPTWSSWPTRSVVGSISLATTGVVRWPG